MTGTAILQLQHREAFEKNTTRALMCGAAAGVLHALASRFGLGVPLSYLATVAAVLACVGGDKLDRPLLAVLAVLGPALPFVFGLSPWWTMALSGAAAGAVMVRARLCARGEEGQVGEHRPGSLNYALCAGLGAAMACGGVEVAKALSRRLADLETPLLLAAPSTGAALSLFVVLASVGAHLALRPDPVEARCEELIPRLEGELQGLATRLLSLYRQCGESLATLPRQPAREELARTLSQMTRQAVELASEWAGVEAQLELTAQKELQEQIADLDTSAARAKDALARRQLEAAAASLREELERLGELALRRERIIARLKSEVALLDRARVALLGLRSGRAQLKASELSALARKFGALSQGQRTEGRLADAEATRDALANEENSALDQDLERRRETTLRS